MIIEEHGYACDRLERGDKLMIGNGSYGYRGTLDEQTADDCVALTAAGFYDRNGDNWRENVNMPNPLFVQAFANGVALNGTVAASHIERLDLDVGQYLRQTDFVVNGVNVRVRSRRFFVQTRHDLLVSEWTLTADTAVTLTVRSGIDCAVWNVSGAHFAVSNVTREPLTVTATTNEGQTLAVEVTEQYSPCTVRHLPEHDGKYLNEYTLNGANFTLRKFCRLSHTDACWLPYDGEPCFDDFVAQNKRFWADKWATCKVDVKSNDEKLQLAVDYSVYQLLCYAPKLDGLSIGARGLSGQTYKGAVFWDTEIFMLPFYLATDAAVAKRLVRYRIDTLNGALDKAARYGYEGAFYAWESQNGFDACSDFNVTDVFTNRPVRTYFKDKQIHVTAAVALALFNTFRVTSDLSLLTDGGAETLIQCALFFDSYAYYNPRRNRLELLDVVGPDEYHERVNNNAYTNYVAHETALACLQALRILRKKSAETYARLSEQYADAIKRIKRFEKLIYLPQPNEQGVIEQFDGYFALENVSVDTVRSRLVHPNEYWGGSNGVATATRVIKQADVVALMAVLPHRFPLVVQQANFDYYLPYTEHGSSLSASMYSLVACRVGRAEQSYEWFKKTATTDLFGGGKKYAGKVYIGGLHPAACGGTWLVLAQGYAAKFDGSCLPKQIKKLTIRTEKGVTTTQRKKE